MSKTPAVVLVLAVVAGGLKPGHAQTQPPVFRATTNLVEISVVALDRRGNPVTDLRKEDLTLLDNGRRREIAFFRYEGGPAPAPAKKTPPLPANVFTNRVEFTGGPTRNITALLLDTLNTEPNDQMFVKAQTMAFLSALAPETRVAVFQLGRDFRVLHDFTDDMDSLRKRLSRFRAEFPRQNITDVERVSQEAEDWLQIIAGNNAGEVSSAGAQLEAMLRAQVAGEVNSNAAVRRNRVGDAMAVLELLGRHLAGIPGRKSVVWISGGLALATGRVTTTDTTPNPAAGEVFNKMVRETSRRLAQIGVVLYTVDARGLTSGAESLAARQYAPPAVMGGGGSGRSGRFSGLEQSDAAGRDNRAAFALMTGITGGRSFYNSNDFSEGIRKATADMRGAYTVSFYSDAAADGAWRTVKVAAGRAGVVLLHRTGYFTGGEPASRQPWDEEQMRWALLNPLGSSAIHLNARCDPVPAEPGSLELTVQIDTEDLRFTEEQQVRRAEIEVVLGEITAEGQVTFQQDLIRTNLTQQYWQQAREEGIPYTKRWKARADTVNVRVLVRDLATGRMGTLDVPMRRIRAGA